MKEFRLNLNKKNVPESDLINDLIRVSGLISGKLSKSKYNELGSYSSSTIERRFGSWREAIKKANLELNPKMDVTDEELYANLQEVWIILGRQPTYTEMKQPLSKFSVGPYLRRFGKWNDALQAFVEYINSEAEETISEKEIEREVPDTKIEHKTKRTISERMRFKVLLKDGFTCQSCGASPLKSREIELHVDHVMPWSKGGETVPSNLQTKCSKCNLGKGNAFNL